MTARSDDDHERAPAAPRARLGLRCFVAALGGAAATGLATPPVGLAWLQWPALALVLVALGGLRVRAAACVGFALGVGVNLSLFTWLGVATARLGHLPLAAGVALFVVWAALASLQFALVGALDAAVSARWPAARRALVPCAFVAGETLWPAVIPWSLGLPQLAWPTIAQVAELGGAALLTFVVVVGAAGLEAVAALVRDALARRPLRWRDRIDAGGSAAVVAAAVVFGAVRLGQLEAAPPGASARVAIVQPGLASNRLTPRTPAEVQAALERAARAVGAAGGVDLAVFPEATAARNHIELVPGAAGAAAGVIAEEARRAREELARVARLCGAPTIIGVNAMWVAPGDTLERSRIVERRNAAVLLDAQGAIVDRYDKHALLVVAEHLPGEATLPWLRTLAPFAGRYTPGEGPRRLRAGELSLAPLICFEAVPGGPTREATRAGPVDLLVNLTNDVWFPGQGPHLHALAASLRAIEARRALVRATTTGRSFAVLPDGRRIAEAPPGVLAVRVVDLPLDRSSTFHSTLGYTFGWLATLIIVVTASASRVIRSPGGDQADS